MPAWSPEWERRRWHLLAEFTFRWDEQLERPEFRDCKGCTAVCVGREFRVPPLRFKGWPACPLHLLGGTTWAEVSRVYRASKVSPLAGWSHEFVAFAEAALVALHAEEQAAVARATKAALDGPGRNGLPPLSQNGALPRASRRRQ